MKRGKQQGHSELNSELLMPPLTLKPILDVLGWSASPGSGGGHEPMDAGLWIPATIGIPGPARAGSERLGGGRRRGAQSPGQP